MGEYQSWGRILIFTGLFIVIIGGMVSIFGQNLTWLGNLPGDIKIEKENFKLFFPITTILLISLIVNLAIFIIKYLVRLF